MFCYNCLKNKLCSNCFIKRLNILNYKSFNHTFIKKYWPNIHAHTNTHHNRVPTQFYIQIYLLFIFSLGAVMIRLIPSLKYLECPHAKSKLIFCELFIYNRWPTGPKVGCELVKKFFLNTAGILNFFLPTPWLAL